MIATFGWLATMGCPALRSARSNRKYAGLLYTRCTDGYATPSVNQGHTDWS